MKVGIRIPGAGPWAGPDAISKIAQFAEKVGFDSLWMTEPRRTADEGRHALPLHRGREVPLGSGDALPGLPDLAHLGRGCDRAC